MKHNQVIQLYINLSKVSGIEGRQITYTIRRNLKSLQPEIETYREEEQEIEKILAAYNAEAKKLEEVIKPFQKERDRLRKKYTNDVDFEREVVKLSDIEPHKTNIKKYEDDLEALAQSDPHKESIKKFEDKWAELAKFRTEKDSKFELMKIKMEDIPENVSKENMDLIFELIEE